MAARRFQSDTSEPTPPRCLRVLVANEEPEKLTALVSLVAGLGHAVIAGIVGISQVVEVTAREQPDVALVSLGPSSEHALAMIDQIVREAACPAIALLHDPDPEFVNEASRRGVFAAITDRDPGEWQSAIDVALCRFAEYHSLRSAFSRRATIERATGILMERHSAEAAEAFEQLRDAARRGNRKVSDLAAAVVDGHSLLPQEQPVASS